MRKITLYGAKERLWDLFESLLLEGVKAQMVGDAQYVIIPVKEISVGEAEDILSEDICRHG